MPPTWVPINRGFSLSRGTFRSRAVQLYFADDIPLVDGEPPNSADLFQTFGLPQLGSPGTALGIPGVVVDHQLVGPCIRVGSAARATVAVFYDSSLRFRLEPRVRTYILNQSPIPFTVPLLYRVETPAGVVVYRKDEPASIHRAQWHRVVAVRMTGDIDLIFRAAAEQVGNRYIFGGIPYILLEPGQRQLDNGQIEMTYRFWTTGRVRAVAPDTGHGPHLPVPALGHLDEYAVHATSSDAVVGVNRAQDLYPLGAELPGGIG